MLRYYINLFVLIAVNGAPNSNIPHFDGKIVGGVSTYIEEYPYQVSVQNGGYHICGGSIISQTYVITAAHCTHGTYFNQLSVRVGSSTVQKGGLIFRVGKVFQNPLFQLDTLDYDVSILRLTKAIKFGSSALPISLAPADYKITQDANLIVTGWGTLSEDGVAPSQLQMVVVSFVDKEECQHAYSDTVLSERMICAGEPFGGKDSCQGDSGGPLVTDGVLVGIVSWGYGCARPEFPGVYSKISQLRQYIRNVTNL